MSGESAIAEQPTSETFSLSTGNMTPTWHPRGAVDLPLLGTKGAPKKFTGQAGDVNNFLRHYEKLCDKCHVVLDEEKIENITQYCSRKVREFLEALGSYKDGTWSDFKKDIKEFFNADRDERRFRIRDLEKFCSQARHAPTVKDLATWRKYIREFIRIAGWLKQQGKLTTSEYNTYFWLGIPYKFRDRLEQRIMSQDPSHDLSTPFDTDTIKKVAKALLRRDRFDREHLPSDDEDSDSDEYNDDEDSESSNSDSEDSDIEAVRKHRATNSKKRRSTSRVRFSSRSNSDTDSEDEAVRKTQRKDKKVSSKRTSDAENVVNLDTSRSKDRSRKSEQSADKEVEDLINKLNRMSINDPAYPLLYFRACRLSPLVQQIIPSPLSAGPKTATGPAPSSTARDTPPHLERRSYEGPRTLSCYGCGEDGHGMSTCPELAKLEQKKIVKRDARGRWCMFDGSPIQRRTPTEPLVKAIARQNPSQTNYISYHQAPVRSDDDDTDFERLYPVILPSNYYMSQYYDESDSDYDVYAAERTERTIRNARKEKFDGVWPPDKRKQRDQIRRPEATAGREKENTVPPTVKPKVTTQTPTPVEVHKPILVNPEDSDAFMEDDFAKTTKSRKPATVKKDTPPATRAAEQEGEKEPTKERHARVSDLQSRTNVQGILQKVLKAPITIEVGEILGVSKEMAHQVQEALKPRTQIARPIGKSLTASEIPTPVVAAASFVPRARGHLIYLHMECDDMPITAIIDTGSQLNVVHRAAWKGAIKRPMDITRQIKMGDANGGEGTLTGFIPNVPLRCGDVLTHASVFVGENAPFDLLLGRPWQRGNFVSIDERVDGTYLLFKDRSMTVRYEILVTPELAPAHDPAITEYLAKVGELANYMVSTATLPTKSKTNGPRNYIKQAEELCDANPATFQDLTEKLERMRVAQDDVLMNVPGETLPSITNEIPLDVPKQPPNSPKDEGEDDKNMVESQDLDKGQHAAEDSPMEWSSQASSHDENSKELWESSQDLGYETDCDTPQVLSAHVTRTSNKENEYEDYATGYITVRGNPPDPGIPNREDMSVFRYRNGEFEADEMTARTYREGTSARWRANPEMERPTSAPPDVDNAQAPRNDEHRLAHNELISDAMDRQMDVDHVPSDFRRADEPEASENPMENEDSLAGGSSSSAFDEPSYEFLERLTQWGSCPACGSYIHDAESCPLLEMIGEGHLLRREPIVQEYREPERIQSARQGRTPRKRRRLTIEPHEGQRQGEPPPRV